MVHKSKALHTFGAFLFALGILLGVLITITRAVPDMEAWLYGFTKDGYPRLSSLHCPMLMTSQDRLPVTVRLTNPSDHDLTWFVSAQFSNPVLISTDEQRLTLTPRVNRVISWEVDQKNIDLNSFIFAYVFASPSAVLRMTEGTCGTFVLKIPMQGGPTIYYATLGASVLLALVGLGLWLRHAEMSEAKVVSQAEWMGFLTIIVAIAVVTSVLSLWFFAVIFLVITMLTLVVYLVRY